MPALQHPNNKRIGIQFTPRSTGSAAVANVTLGITLCRLLQAGKIQLDIVTTIVAAPFAATFRNNERSIWSEIADDTMARRIIWLLCRWSQRLKALAWGGLRT